MEDPMRRTLTTLAAVCLLAGCGTTCRSAKTLQTSWGTIGSAYRAYVEADEALDAAQKERRLRHAEEFGGLIDAMAEGCDG